MRRLGFLSGAGRGLHRLRSSLAVAVVLAAAAALLAREPAIAGLVTAPAPRPARVIGLSAPERRAITLTSLSAAGDDSLGLIVTAEFAGDVGDHLGQRGLEHGLLALTLLSSGSPRPAGRLLSEGGGSTPTRLTLLERRGGHTGVTHRTFNLFSPDRTVRTAGARGVQVIRDRDEVVFHVPAADLAGVNTIRLEVFVNPPKPVEHSTIERGHEEAQLRPARVASPRPGGSRLPARGRAPSAAACRRRSQRRARPRSAYRRTGETTARLARLDGEIVSVTQVLDRADALIKACTSPPPPAQTTPTPTTPTQTTLQTTPAPALSARPRRHRQSRSSKRIQGYHSRWRPSRAVTRSSTPPSGVPIIDVNDQLRYQEFSGIGAAMTDSSASLIQNGLSASDRLTLLQNLFGASGIRPELPTGADGGVGLHGHPRRRTPTTTCHPARPTRPCRSSRSSTTCPTSFPALQLARSVNPGLEILANPWSPPAWMKANDSLDNSNDKGTLLTSSYGPLASYFVKVIQAYQNAGVSIDAITPQNEPRTPPGAGTSYPGLTLPDTAEASFISAYLAPALQAAHLSTKIYGNDLSWDQLSDASGLTTSSALSDLSGIAWHCYFGSPTVMSQLHQAAPGLDQIEDECSPELRNFGTPELLISTLRNWASVVALWNVALDPSGGPKGTNNGCPGCTGVVTIDSSAHTVTYSNEYYELGQVSAFVSPGATRVDSQNFVTYGLNGSNILTVSSGLDDVAFVNPDGSHVLVAYDNSTAPISFGVQANGEYFTYTIPSKAMTTFVWK